MSVPAMGRPPISDAVLVHGSFSSAASWDPVLPGLRAGGLEPHTVTLPGHGHRIDEAGPDIDLYAHASAVVEHVQANGLDNIMLVGHSYGGMPVTQAWDALRDRVRAVVYVDAGVAENGESQFDLLGPEIAAVTREIAAANGGMLPAPNRDTPSFPLAVSSMETPVRLGVPLPAGVPRVLVLATDNTGNHRYHHRQAAELRGRPDWTIVEMDCGHNVLGERTGELVALLLGLAGPSLSAA
ncbi:MAG: alpha/beta hydrolase [Acidimicrobiales bacterium]